MACSSLLLPGLDGTGDLFAPFEAAAPAGFSVRALRLPNSGPQSYRELASWVVGQLPPEPVALIAESFSGPLALLVAERAPSVVAVVLCTSFVEPPLPSLLAHAPKILWSRPPPLSLLTFFLTGGDRALAESLRSAIAMLEPDIIAQRVAAALRVDVGAVLQRLAQPILYLRATQDRVVHRGSVARIRALKPSATIVDINAPHLVLQTAPVEAWQHIAPFLEAT